MAQARPEQALSEQAIPEQAIPEQARSERAPVERDHPRSFPRPPAGGTQPDTGQEPASEPENQPENQRQGPAGWALLRFRTRIWLRRALIMAVRVARLVQT
ncbi:MAG: hypothetical protein JWO34_2436, partial [Arthrobacter sp.]|nr:hypothetical protein [Arthrobacter sp.]